MINNDLNVIYGELEDLLIKYKNHKDEYLENVIEKKKDALIKKLKIFEDNKNIIGIPNAGHKKLHTDIKKFFENYKYSSNFVFD